MNHLLWLGVFALTQIFAQEPDANTPTPARRQARRTAASSVNPAQGVLPQETFRLYNAQPLPPSSYFAFSDPQDEEQPSFKVSLVGVNVNAWLENPDSYTALEESAQRFPVRALLNNIAHNSPNLQFNDPQLVRALLHTDIYTPYLKNRRLPPSFSERRGTVSFTRNYHIYGAAAGGLPYFGIPAEGSDRNIILAVIKDQLLEYGAKLPDTDIFLVASINIVPNWLEEGWDVRHVNRQEAGIFVYAFNRKGKLIGSAGVPRNFYTKGSFIEFPQRAFSSFWQRSAPRVFYIIPSFKIINTPVAGSQKKAPSGDFPTSARPYLNKVQRYIARSLANIYALGETPLPPLFDEEGNPSYKIKPEPDRPFPYLVKRSLRLTNSPVQKNPEINVPQRVFSELEGFGRRQPIKDPLIKEKTPKEEQRIQKKNEKLSQALAEAEAKTAAQEEARIQAQAELKEKVRILEEKAAQKEAAAQQKLEKKAAQREAAAQRKAELKKASQIQKEKPSPEPTAYFMDLPSQQQPLTLRAQDIGGASKISPTEKKQQLLEEKKAEALSNQDNKARSAARKATLRRQFFPSNERGKIQGLLSGLSDTLSKPLSYNTNAMQAVTNSIPSFETQSDPLGYHSQRKRYYSVKKSAQDFEKRFRQESKLYRKAFTAYLNDLIFWPSFHRLSLMENELWTPALEVAFRAYLEQLHAQKKMELARFAYQRDNEFLTNFRSRIRIFEKRALEEALLTAKKEEQKEQRSQKIQNLSASLWDQATNKFSNETYIQKKREFWGAYVTSRSNFLQAQERYYQMLPPAPDDPFPLDISPMEKAKNPASLAQKREWDKLAARNKVPLSLIAYARGKNISYPSKRFLESAEGQALREYRKNTRFLTMEGFMLGLSGSWRAKTHGSDNMTSL